MNIKLDQMNDTIFERLQTTEKRIIPLKRHIGDLEFLQENYWIQNTDKTFDNPLDRGSCYTSSVTTETNTGGQQTDRKKLQLEDMPETQNTFLQSHEQGRQESRQSIQTADVEESTVVSDKQSLPQHSDDDLEITASAIRNT